MSEQDFLRKLGLTFEDFYAIARNIRRMKNISPCMFSGFKKEAIKRFQLDLPEKEEAIRKFVNDLQEDKQAYSFAEVQWPKGLPTRETYAAIYDYMLRNSPEDRS